MIRTPFTAKAGIHHPLIQSGMSDAGPDLVVAVCEAGALGSLGTMGKSPEQIRDQVAEVRARTAAPFAVNVATFDWAPFWRDVVDAAVHSGAPWVTLSFGDPEYGLRACAEAGVGRIVQVQDLQGAQRALSLGADLVIAQGHEAGGHTGLRGTLSFAAQVLNLAGTTPVGIAGGIGDGRGVAAALAMGAAAAVMGTRFKTCPEFPAHPWEKDEILENDGDDTYAGPETDQAYGLTWPEGVVGRAVGNRFTREWAGRSDDLRAKVAADPRPFGFVRDLVGSGTSVNWAGESAGLVSRSIPAGEVVAEVMRDAEVRLRAVAAMLQPAESSAI